METQQIIENPTISKYTTNKTAVFDVYFVDDKIHINGHGFDDYIFPNLILLRDNEYKFNFLDKSSVITFYDLNGNLIAEHDLNNWHESFNIKFDQYTPSELIYKVTGSLQYGRVNVRSPNQINGRVSGFGFANNAEVISQKFSSYTNQDGLFLGYVLNTVEYPVIDDTITAYVSNDSLINRNVNFDLKTLRGSLILNTFTTLCEKIQSEFNLKDYHELQDLVKKYFGLSNNCDLLNDDLLEQYIIGKNSKPKDWMRLVIFSFIVDYTTQNFGVETTTKLYKSIATDIVNTDTKFNYYNLNGNKFSKSINYDRLFVDNFNNLTVRLFSLRTHKQKKECVVKDIISLVNISRDIVFLKINYDDVNKNYKFILNSYYNDVLFPNINNKLILRNIDGCTVAPFGKIGYVNVNETLLKNVFSQKLPLQNEIKNHLIGLTLRIGEDENSFCYTIEDFLMFSDENIPEINLNVIESYTISEDCCFTEKNSRPTKLQPSYLESVPEESDLLSFELIEGDGGVSMLNYVVTNENSPYEQIGENKYRFYINKLVRFGSSEGTSPSYISMPNEFAKFLENKKITIAYNTDIPILKINRVRYDYIDTKIISSSMAYNGVLSIETEHSHGHKIGDEVEIKSSSRNGIIDGKFKVIDFTEFTLELEFLLPLHIDKSSIENVGGVIRAFNSSKIYCDVNKFRIGDYLVFEESVIKGRRFKIVDIKSDFMGDHLVVSGFVPSHASIFTKSHVQSNMENVIEFEHQQSMVYYDVLGVNSNETQLWLTKFPDIFLGGRYGSVLSYIEINYNKNITKVSDSTNLIGFDFVYKSKSNQILGGKTELQKLIIPDKTKIKTRSDDFDIDDISSDWNMDGEVNEEELKILERYILTRPNTIEEYNYDRGAFPLSEVLPNVVTAQYACQELCCHDDFTSTENFILEDVYVYDAFQHYVDALGSEPIGDIDDLEAHYDILEVQGLLPELQVQVIYMPTDPREFQRCGDYTENGSIVSDDSNIYYANYLYTIANGGKSPPSVEVFNIFYNALVEQGTVPSLIEPIKKLPSLESEETITAIGGELNKNCEDISWKDLQIMNEWLRQGKPTSLDEFNENRADGVPRACFLPIEDYDSIGTSDFKIKDLYTGLENL